MEISNNSYNQPVNFYNKNTGNTINMAIDGDNYPYTYNVFAPELSEQLKNKNIIKPKRKKRKSKRLNTIDTEYLPEEFEDSPETINEDENNFFVETKQNRIKLKAKKAWNFFIENTPLVNYFFLRQKKHKIEKTVKSLSDISQNVDELLNSAIPYGEEKELYTNIAKNLTDAASILGKANREI